MTRTLHDEDSMVTENLRSENTKENHDFSEKIINRSKRRTTMNEKNLRKKS